MLNEEKRGESVYFENNAVGKTIRMLRTNKDLSQEILSGMSGIARTHLTMIENGTKKAKNDS